MQLGSIWGHGSYVAPDWTADWLHREALFMLDAWARQEDGTGFAELEPERQAALQRRLRLEIRTNRFEPRTGVLTIHPLRARAFEANLQYLTRVFTEGEEAYAIPA
jgi:nitric oxide reductase subunit B